MKGQLMGARGAVWARRESECEGFKRERGPNLLRESVCERAKFIDNFDQ